MSRACILFLALLIAGCAHAPGADRASAPHRIDTSCMQDCMGSQAGREFCEDRCSF